LEWANRSGGYYDPFRGRLVNRGVWRKTTGERVELENATLVNEAGGVLELVAGSLYRYSGSATLQNSGLIKKVSSNSAVALSWIDALQAAGVCRWRKGCCSWSGLLWRTRRCRWRRG
jgi:hypothetical protein